MHQRNRHGERSCRTQRNPYQFCPKIVLCAGSAGGLHPKTRVRDVVIGTEYINSRADATAFGYAPGQVPGSPASLHVSKEISAAIAQTLKNISKTLPEITAYSGQMLSSDAFVTDANAENTRTLFPDGISADMESQAFAQTASRFENTPFAAIRGISDLCAAPEDQSISFHAELSDVASRAAKAALEIYKSYTASLSAQPEN
ncbi:5'-methylthioadenosine/S-adenosylhomocysteine nucleosidase [Arcanobacterium hippocoleae]